MRVIYQSQCGFFRIIEKPDFVYSLDDLKGDVYKADLHPEIDPDQIKREEKEFEELVEAYGVFGYVLQQWIPTPDHGWTHVNSCWGFVGPYTEADQRFGHYIVDEMKEIIKDKGGK